MKKVILALLIVFTMTAFFLYCGGGGGNNPTDGGGQDAALPDGGGQDASLPDGGEDYDGSVDHDGGTVTLFKFGVYGDSRPPYLDEFPGPALLYENITKIMKGLASKNVQFVFQVGDYMYCKGDQDSGPCAETDLTHFLLAEGDGGYKGPVFYLMGNHECHYKTEVLCPNENETPNVNFYKSMLLSRDGKPHSWFDFNVNTSKGPAHFIVGSPNTMPYGLDDGGYDGAFFGPQADWLKTVASEDAGYTFYLQHEPQADESDEGTCIGAAPLYHYMRAANQNVTAYLYGHTHYYKKLSKDDKGDPVANEAIIGNGGAPVDYCTKDGGSESDCRTVDGGTKLCSCSNEVGYGVLEQLSNGNVRVSIYKAEGAGHDPLIDQWTITAQGKAAN